MAQWQLAQLNIASTLAPLESPIMAGFVAELDRINKLAEDSPGFVWRFGADGAEADPAIFGADKIVNVSVWTSVEALHNYVYRSAHTDIMRQRKQWFKPMDEAYTVLWWVPAGHTPDLTEALERLTELQTRGPSEMAFTFKKRIDMPESIGEV